MRPKTLLTVIGSDQPIEALQQATTLAADTGASLSVAVIGVAYSPPVSVYNVVPLQAWSDEREEGMQQVRAKGDEVSALLSKSDISGDVSPHYCDEGQIERTIGRRARFCDLALASRRETPLGILWRKSLSGLLFQSARPVLIAPSEALVTLEPDCVMIAWNSSREAARAVYCALDILVAAKKVQVVIVDPVASEHDDGEEPGNDIAGYLAHHGINVEVEVLSAAARDVSSVLLTHATDIDAGMIVMGAYGHSRLFEQVFGGTTLNTLENTDRPVLMAH